MIQLSTDQLQADLAAFRAPGNHILSKGLQHEFNGAVGVGPLLTHNAAQDVAVENNATFQPERFNI